MKIFHLSDLHIGLKLFNKDLRDDQAYIFDRIIELAGQEQPDAVIIAGDIYDKAVPSAEAVQLFDYFITGLVRAVPGAEIMMISGNHDSAPRVNVFRNILEQQRIHMVGLPPVSADEYIEKAVLTDAYGEVVFYLLPFVRPSMVREVVQVSADEGSLSYDETIRRLIDREKIDTTRRNVLVSHQFYLPAGTDPDKVERMDSEIRTVGNIDAVSAAVLEPFDYAALGHIHKPMKAGSGRFRYCGTPLACSVSEAGQEKGIVVVELKEKGSIETTVLPLCPKRRVRVITGPLQEVLTKGCEDYVTVILTDRVDLDVIDMQDRLRNAFPNLLEVRREYVINNDMRQNYTPDQELDMMALCRQFLGDLDDEEAAVLQDVINTVQEVHE